MIDRRKRSSNLNRFIAAVFMLVSAFLFCVVLTVFINGSNGAESLSKYPAASPTNSHSADEVKNTGTVILLTTPAPSGTAQAAMNPTPETVEGSIVPTV